MENWIVYILIVIAAFVAMEGVAWFTHKYVMHGIFWHLHHDHHQKDHPGFFERNDFFFVIFAIPGMACIALGGLANLPVFGPVGIGITLYGACYFFVHDLFIHQRIKVLRNSNNWYLTGIRRAHKMHHKHTGKEDGECFGMLWVPVKYFMQSRKSKAA